MYYNGLMMESSQNSEATDRAIMEIINGKRSMSFEFMATNILVKHIQILDSEEPSEKKPSRRL